MSTPHSRRGRHAAPGSPVGRRLATAAAALAAGTVPLAAAGPAVAATVQGELSTLGLPNAGLPLGLPDSAGSLAAGLPVVQELPVNEVVADAMPPLNQVMQVGDLGLLGQKQPAAAGLERSAVAQDQAGTLRTDALDTAGLNTGAMNTTALAQAAQRALGNATQHATGGLISQLPVANVVPQLAANTGGGPLELAPNVLREGALGTVASGFAPQADDLTGGVVGQAAPLVGQLRSNGVPTVGDLTSKLSRTQLPVVGNVGGLTSSLPVTSVLGAGSPVTGTLQNLDGI